MRTRVYATALIFVSTISAYGQDGGAAAVAHKWAEAYSSNSTEAVVAIYTDDALLFGNRSKTLGEGKDAVRTYFAKIASGNKLTIREQKVVALGENAAYSTGICDFIVTRDGKPVSSPSRFSMVLVKKDGQWRIAHQHVSRQP
jgi:uncharacterized protein (TIGR02246 family)